MWVSVVPVFFFLQVTSNRKRQEKFQEKQLTLKVYMGGFTNKQEELKSTEPFESQAKSFESLHIRIYIILSLWHFFQLVSVVFNFVQRQEVCLSLLQAVGHGEAAVDMQKAVRTPSCGESSKVRDKFISILVPSM